MKSDTRFSGREGHWKREERPKDENIAKYKLFMYENVIVKPILLYVEFFKITCFRSLRDTLGQGSEDPSFS